MNLRMEYTLAEGDYLEAQQNVKLPQGKYAGTVLLLFLLLFAGLILGTNWVVDRVWPIEQVEAEVELPAGRSTLLSLLIGLMPYVYAVVVLVMLAKVQRRMILRAIWKQSPSLHALQTLQLTDTGITEESCFGGMHLRWAAVQAFRETPRLLLLQASAGACVFIPKRALPEGTDLPALRGWISERVNALGLAAEAFASRPREEVGERL